MNNRQALSKLLFNAVLALSLIGLGRPASAVLLGFNQLDWLDGGGGYTSQNSDWGQVVFNFSSIDTNSFTFTGSEYIGYLNVVTTVSGGSANNWAVKNLPIVMPDVPSFDEYLPYEVNFSLGTSPGFDVGLLDYVFTIDSSPLSLAPSGLPTTTPVGNIGMLIGGEDDPLSEGGLQNNPTPAQNFEGAPDGAVVTNYGRVAGAQTNIPSVNEDDNGCAPGAVARSIAYLGQRAGVTVTQTAQQMYESLKGSNYMQTSIGTNGNGTAIANFISGKNRFFISNGLAISPTRVTNNFAAAMQALRQTGDVEMGVFWGLQIVGNVTNSLGGHAVMVTGINEIRSNGVVVGYTVNYIEDSIQGDGIATNNQRVLQFDAAGNMVNGPGLFAGLNSFRIEMAAVPEPGVLGLAAVGAAIMAMLRRRS